MRLKWGRYSISKEDEDYFYTNNMRRLHELYMVSDLKWVLRKLGLYYEFRKSKLNLTDESGDD